MSNRTFVVYMLVLFVCAAFILYVHGHVEPKTGVAPMHSKVAMMSDKDQEKAYCLAYLNGEAVTGATDAQIRAHCKKYTY